LAQLRGRKIGGNNPHPAFSSDAIQSSVTFLKFQISWHTAQ
jgi:hypothetical protein